MAKEIPVSLPGKSEEKPLPTFRQDLRLFPGPNEVDGSPTYNLFDPTRGQYFKMNWTEWLVFKHLRARMTADQLIQEIKRNTTLDVTQEDIKIFFQDAYLNNLLDVKKPSEAISEEAKKSKTGIFKWLIFHYLYIRVPLINPDKFLTKTLHYVLPLASKFAFSIYFAIFLVGLFQLITHLDEYLSTFPYFFSVQGAFFYILGVSIVKIIHEFAHAYTAKYYKIFVPTMGAAFIVFWPVLYTDVTDGWRLAKRSQRLAISWAGIIAELTLAGLCTLGWALSPPGMVQSMFFVVSSITWISTLAVNLNPAMRFDGYYILSDMFGIDNLQARAFATTRWQLRKWLLNIDVPPPETHLSFKRKFWMMVYSIYTWIYRLFLYTAIAIFVYYQFTKLLGIFLFILEIAIFIIWPLTWEIGQIKSLRAHINLNRRSVTTLIITTLFFLWLIVPLPHRQSFTSIVIPNYESSQVIYVPYDGQIREMFVKRDDYVIKNQILAKIFSETLLEKIAESEVDSAVAYRQQLIASQTEEDRIVIAEKIAEARAAEATTESLEKILENMTIRAEVSGKIYAWDENLRVNQYVTRNQVLGRIADMDNLQILAFIPEMYISDIKEGDVVTFRRTSDFAKFPGKVVKILPTRNRTLLYPQLASIHHGDLPVVEQAAQQPAQGQPSQGQQHQGRNQYTMVESYYNALVEIDQPTEDMAINELGYTDVRGVWRSYLSILWTHLRALILREGTL